MKPVCLAFVGLLALGGCDDGAKSSAPRELIANLDSDGGGTETEFGFMEAMEPTLDPFGASAPRASRAVAGVATVDIDEPPEEVGDPASAEAGKGEQIAYKYAYGFQVDEDAIRDLQRDHIALCEDLGTGCRILRVSQASTDGWDGYGELQMQVAASEAASFADKLVTPAQQRGGELISSVRDGEDVTEAIIDSEAKLRSRLVLRDKLTDILRNNSGSVDELVKAEQAVANVNEQIDATRSKLEKYRNRVRYSEVRIECQPFYGSSQLGFVRPVLTAFQSIGTTLGMTTALIIYALTALMPVGLLLLALRWLLHRFGLRFRFWRKPEEEAA